MCVCVCLLCYFRDMYDLNLFANTISSNLGLWPHFAVEGMWCVYDLPKFSLLVCSGARVRSQSLTPELYSFLHQFLCKPYSSSRPATPAFNRVPNLMVITQQIFVKLMWTLIVELLTILLEQDFAGSGEQSRHTHPEVNVSPECHVGPEGHVLLPSPLPSPKENDFKMTPN